VTTSAAQIGAIDEAREATALLESLIGRSCWYASHGESVGATFSLAFGKKVQRKHPLQNEAHRSDFRHYEGEYALYVWCTWRLDGPDAPISSSDDTHDRIGRALGSLIEKKVLAICRDLPGWDLRIDFSGGLVLRLFCDHVDGDPSFSGNWELCTPGRTVVIDVNSKCRVAREVG